MLPAVSAVSAKRLMPSSSATAVDFAVYEGPTKPKRIYAKSPIMGGMEKTIDQLKTENARLLAQLEALDDYLPDNLPQHLWSDVRYKREAARQRQIDCG